MISKVFDLCQNHVCFHSISVHTPTQGSLDLKATSREQCVNSQLWRYWKPTFQKYFISLKARNNKISDSHLTQTSSALDRFVLIIQAISTGRMYRREANRVHAASPGSGNCEHHFQMIMCSCHLHCAPVQTTIEVSYCASMTNVGRKVHDQRQSNANLFSTD